MRARLLSPGEASVLGLAVVVVERLQPSNEAKTTPEDLVRARVVANVVGSPGTVREKSHTRWSRSKVVRDRGAGRPRDHVSGAGSSPLQGLFAALFAPIPVG